MFLGRILTVETQEIKQGRNSSGVDPDRTSWSEHGGAEKLYLMMLRIFYVIAMPACEAIGLVDFVPQGAGYRGSEPYSNVLLRAAAWVAQQSSVRFTNVKCIELKIKEGECDTQRTYYTEHANRRTNYAKFLRIAYVHSASGVQAPSPPLQLSYKCFSPYPLGSWGTYETMSQTLQRMSAWMAATGARVLSAETCAMRLMTGGERHNGAESTYTYNRGERNEVYIYVIRTYLDGYYREPDPSQLPPVPEMPDDCCTIL